jgi:hypothetical protein
MLLFLLTRTLARRIPLLLAVQAYAAEPGLAVADPGLATASATLEVDADPRCTTRADLMARVRARSPRVRFVDDDSGLLIRVQISPMVSGGIAGDVALGSRGSTPSVRHVPARSCTEAADAVALIIAVILDPTAADTRPNGSIAKESAPTAANGASTARQNTSGAATTAPAASPKPNSPAMPAATEVSNEGARTPAPSRGTFAAQVAFESFVGVAPGVMPSIALFGIAGVDRPTPWSPVLVLGVRHAWLMDVEEPGGNASFMLDAATLDACPLRFRLGLFDARPCGSLLFGRLSARGTETLNAPTDSARPFWVVGGAAIVTARLAWQVELSGRLAVGANLVRDSFAFSPTTFHTVPPVSAAASVGIGVGWP